MEFSGAPRATPIWDEEVMQLTETKAEGLKREYSVVVEAAQLDEKINEKLETVRADFQMKGFRKGKAPTPLLKKMFGKSLLGEAVQETVDGAVRDIFEENGDRPAQQPDVKIVNEDYSEGDDLRISVSYERLPDIPEADFSKVSLERLVATVEDGAIDEALSNLAENATTFVAGDADAEAVDGDQVVIDFLGKVDGEAFDGGAADDYPLVLGSNSFIPGFEDQLAGLKAGDEKDVNVTFPENYGADHLAGKDAVFECKVKEVRKPQAAAIDDDLAKRFGVETLDELKGQVSERLAEEYKGASRSLLKRQLLDQLDELVSFDLPEIMVEAEAFQVAHQLWHEAHPEVHGHDHGEVPVEDEHRELASRRVRLGLLLADVGQKNSIEVSEAEVNAALIRQAGQYAGREREFFEWARNNEQVLASIRSPIFEDKVVDFVLEMANVTDKDVTKDELQAALEALDAEDKAEAGDE